MLKVINVTPYVGG